MNDKLIKVLNNNMAAMNTRFGLQPLQQDTQHSTPPTPQEAPKKQDKQLLQQAITEVNTEINAEKQGPQPLHQATVEDNTEDDNTMHGNSVPVITSTLSTKPRLCSTPACRDPAACPTNLLAFSFGSFFGSTSFLTSFLASQLGYIRYMEGMEASGEGWMTTAGGRQWEWPVIQRGDRAVARRFSPTKRVSIRQYLGQHAIRLLSMDLDHLDPYIRSLICGRRRSHQKHSFSAIFSLLCIYHGPSA